MAVSKGDRPLTRLQQRFCEEFVIDLNATAAYQRAGYKGTEDAARASASKLLTNHNIQSHISQLQGKRSQRTQITADRVLVEIARIAFANITDVVSWDSESITPIKSSELSSEVAPAIAEVAMSETQTEFATTRQIKVKMHDKLRALGKLSDHLGLNFTLDDMVKAVLTQGYAVSNPALPSNTSEVDPLAEIDAGDT